MFIIPYMPTPEPGLVHQCLERLRELPFVEKVVLRKETARPGRGDGLIRIVTPTLKKDFMVEVERTHLTQTLVDGVIARAIRYGRTPWILMAPHVGRPLARYLAEQDANFVDLVGNCRLRVDRRYFAMVEGRPQEARPQQGRGIGVPGQQVLFALLVRPALLNAPIRTFAEVAGVATATAADRVARLREEGLIAEARGKRRLTEPRRILDRWLKGYENQMRPRLLIGRYRTQDRDPEDLERRVEDALIDDVTWAWGGGAAAYRLTGYYRGPETVVHLQAPGVDVAKRLRALRAKDGPLILLKAPGPVAFEGQKPRTVHPLLVYTELVMAGDKRARNAAVEMQEKYLEHLV